MCAYIYIYNGFNEDICVCVCGYIICVYRMCDNTGKGSFGSEW